MPLSKPQKKHLISLTHNLKPVIMIGQNGLTENILKELDIALDFHELVKIKIASGDKESLLQIIEQLILKTSAEKIKAIGKTLTLFRQNPKKPKIILPKK